MNINQFKAGDIITRNEGAKVNTTNPMVDGSYTGDRLELLGHDKESKIIFLKHKDFDLVKLSYARDGWDEGWAEFPESLYKSIKSKLGI